MNLAVDFLHVATAALTRLWVLAFIEHGTRRMRTGGVTARPTGAWTVQQATWPWTPASGPGTSGSQP
jgi:hypothetical protein